MKTNVIGRKRPVNKEQMRSNVEVFMNKRKNDKKQVQKYFHVSILLLLGCINFINLTTAQAAQRAKEVGIRKTMSGSRKQLLFQFISETFLLTITATLVSLALAPWLLKVFAGFIPPASNISMLYRPHVFLFIGFLIITVSILSGFYQGKLSW